MRTKLAIVFIFAVSLANTVTAAETLTPYSNPALFDANGKFMGHILGYDDRSFLFLFKLSSGENIVLLTQKGIGGQVWRQGPLYYASNNCTGQAYMNTAPDAVDRLSAVGPGDLLYISAAGPSPAFINSFYDQGVCSGLPNFPGNNYIPMNPVVGLDTLFQIPFKPADAAIASAPAINTWTLLLLAITLAATGLFISRFAGRV